MRGIPIGPDDVRWEIDVADEIGEDDGFGDVSIGDGHRMCDSLVVDGNMELDEVFGQVCWMGRPPL